MINRHFIFINRCPKSADTKSTPMRLDNVQNSRKKNHNEQVPPVKSNSIQNENGKKSPLRTLIGKNRTGSVFSSTFGTCLITQSAQTFSTHSETRRLIRQRENMSFFENEPSEKGNKKAKSPGGRRRPRGPRRLLRRFKRRLAPRGAPPKLPPYNEVVANQFFSLVSMNGSRVFWVARCRNEFGKNWFKIRIFGLMNRFWFVCRIAFFF